MKSQSLYSFYQTVLFLFFILFSVLNATTSQAQTATESIGEIHALYNQRFDQNGNFINDTAKTAAFTERQLQVIQSLRQKGHVGSSFQIYNTAMEDLVITVSVIQESNSDFVGLLIERSKYDNTTTASFLRLFNFAILNRGMDVLRFTEGTVIHVKGESLTASDGVLKIRYPIDFNQGKFAESAVRIKVTGFKTDFLSPEMKPFSNVTMDIWFKIFSQNFGVQSIIFQ